MTPYDELMALAGRATPGEWQAMNEYQWDSIIGDIDGPDDGEMHYESVADITSHHERSRANAAFIAAACNFVRSDAFRAMVRDAERLDFYTENQYRIAKSGGKWGAIIGQSSYAFFDTAREAIDAAASGAGGS